MSQTKISQPRYEVMIDKNILIPMKDGITLAADAYRPVDGKGERFPAIIGYYGPYHKDLNKRAYPHDIGMYFAQRGYYVFFVDVRGTGDSEGFTSRLYSEQEQQDGYESIEWLAKQPWCNGKVGMMGQSYGFYSTVLVAATTPPSLKAIIVSYGGVDWYNAGWGYEGGSPGLFHFYGYYTPLMIAMNGMPPAYHDPEGRWKKILDDHLKSNIPWFAAWMENDVDGPYYHVASVSKRYDKVKAASMVINGWYDYYPTEPLKFFMNIKSPKRLIAGPWMHEYPHRARPAPRIDILHEDLRWMDYWLKGIDTGVINEPPVSLHVNEFTHPDVLRDPVNSLQNGKWRHEDEFPPRGTTYKPLYLEKTGIEGLSWSKPSYEHEEDEIKYDPTVGTAAGLIGGTYDTIGLPIDQRFEDPFSLTYVTSPLKRDLEVTGEPIAILHISSSADIAAFVAKLCDVAPDGTTVLVSRRSMNATHHSSHTNPSFLKPNTTYELKIEMGATSYLFKKDHRMKLYVSCADFPHVWPTPKPAVNKVHRGSVYPSRIELPIAPERMSPKAPNFLPPPPPFGDALEWIEPHYWRVSRNMREKSSSVEWGYTNRCALDPDSTLLQEVNTKATAVADRPWDVKLDSTARFVLKKPIGTFDTTGSIHMRSDQQAFYVSASLDIKYDERPYHRTDWNKVYSRKYR